MEAFRPTQVEVVTWLENYPHGVIATMGELFPDAALVGFSANDQLEIMFGTDEISQKAGNLDYESAVCFVVTDVVSRYQVQVYGLAEELSELEYARRRQAHYAKLPTSERFEDEPGQLFYVIRPEVVKFRDCNPSHARDWVVTELKFQG